MNLLVSKKHRILHITLNRADKRNALSAEMCTGITNAISDAQNDDEVGCIVLSAAGPVFCAGMDLDEAEKSQGRTLSAAHEALFSAGSQSLKPIVIGVNGPALGGGLGLAAQGHVVFASEGAVFGLPEIRVGLWPFLVYRSVTTALGARRTLELSLTGDSFSAEQACAWGLVHRVCPAKDIADRCRAMARHLARSSPLALSFGMKYVHDSIGKSREEAGTLGSMLREQLMASADFKEGCLAFKQKREPHWPSMPAEFYAAKPDAQQ